MSYSELENVRDELERHLATANDSGNGTGRYETRAGKSLMARGERHIDAACDSVCRNGARTAAPREAFDQRRIGIAHACADNDCNRRSANERLQPREGELTARFVHHIDLER